MERLRVALVASAMLVATACHDNPTDSSAPSVAGTVINASTGEAVARAQVSIGGATYTTGVNGRFEFYDLEPGSLTIRCLVAGYEDFQREITVPSDESTYDISLIRIERFEFGDFALYAPAAASTIRGVILALGGPDTRAFATASPFGAPLPEVEAALQAAGQELRALAAGNGFAVMGTSLAAMENGPESDQLLVSALQQAVTLSGRPELAVTPLLLYGISGGGPEASGFSVRNPLRVAGLFLKVPASVESPTMGLALEVPTCIVLAEQDAFIDNAALTEAFETSRSAGAPWALALEPAVPHHSLTSAHWELTIDWIKDILALRLKYADPPLSPLVQLDGWLGDMATGNITPAYWPEWPGGAAPQSASWFPSRESAGAWRRLVRGEGS